MIPGWPSWQSRLSDLWNDPKDLCSCPASFGSSFHSQSLPRPVGSELPDLLVFTPAKTLTCGLKKNVSEANPTPALQLASAFFKYQKKMFLFSKRTSLVVAL
jgi:hypothetical protein